VSGDTASDPWFTEVQREMAYLSRLLRRAWPSAERYPHEHLLYQTAVRVVILRQSWQRRTPTPTPKELVASLRKSRREILERWGSRSEDPSQIEAALLLGADRSITALLEYYTFSPIDPVTYLAEPIIEAWRKTHGVTVTLDPQPREGGIPPLTLTVAALFRRAAKIRYRAHTVSEHLADREDRPRGGKSKKSERNSKIAPSCARPDASVLLCHDAAPAATGDDGGEAHTHEHARMCQRLRNPDCAEDSGGSIRREIREPRRARDPPLDDDLFLTSRQTRARVGGVSAMCIWRWIRDPRVQFPAPVKINHRSYWRLGDLRRWQAERASKST
jgi:predicted DNA-binding transcriptional regulator AlpA